MTRSLLPHVDFGRWGGATLTDPDGREEEVRGCCIVIQWLGILIEIGGGRVHSTKAKTCRHCGTL